MKVTIINQHTHNYGDDCAVAALIKLIDRTWGADVDVVYQDVAGRVPYRMPDGDLKFTAHSNLTFTKKDGIAAMLSLFMGRSVMSGLSSSAQDFMSVVRNSDVVFVSPCGANIGVYKDWHFLAKVCAVISSGRTPVFHFNTIGKSGDRIFDFIARKALKRSDVYVRELRSKNYLDQIGVNCFQGVDSAFSLSPVGGKKSQEIVLVLTDLSKWFAFHAETSMDDLFDKLITGIGVARKGASTTVRIIPHLHSVDSEKEFLMKFSEKLRQALPDIHLIVDEEYQDYRAYDQVIAKAGVVISMRYHGLVLAAKNHVPFVGISYENKMMEVARYTEMSQFVVPVEKLESDWLADRIGDCFDNQERIRSDLAARMVRLSEIARSAVNQLWVGAVGAAKA